MFHEHPSSFVSPMHVRRDSHSHGYFDRHAHFAAAVNSGPEVRTPCQQELGESGDPLRRRVKRKRNTATYLHTIARARLDPLPISTDSIHDGSLSGSSACGWNKGLASALTLTPSLTPLHVLAHCFPPVTVLTFHAEQLLDIHISL